MLKRIIFSIAILLSAASASIAQPPRSSVDLLPAATCTSGELMYQTFLVWDSVDGISCTTGGGDGTTPALCACNSAGIYVTVNGVASSEALASYVPVTKAGQQSISATGSGNDLALVSADDLSIAATDFIPTSSATQVLTAPVSSIVATTSMTTTSPIQVLTASTSILATTPKISVSGVYEHKITNVTVADDAAGTKPTGAIPVTTDFATCTCNDATGCTMSIAEPTPTSGYGRMLVVASVGSGNCEFAESAGVTEIGDALVLEPTSMATYAYINAAWHLMAVQDNAVIE